MLNLLPFIRSHPLAVAVSGAASGFAAWVITHSTTIILLFQMIGGFFGCLLTLISFIFVLPRFIRFCRRTRRLGFIKADKE
jgi:hypothetical protein